MTYRAYLIDKDSDQKLFIGEFNATSQGDAVDKAQRKIAPTLNRLATRKWYVNAFLVTDEAA